MAKFWHSNLMTSVRQKSSIYVTLAYNSTTKLYLRQISTNNSERAFATVANFGPVYIHVSVFLWDYPKRPETQKAKK